MMAHPVWYKGFPSLRFKLLSIVSINLLTPVHSHDRVYDSLSFCYEQRRLAVLSTAKGKNRVLGCLLVST